MNSKTLKSIEQPKIIITDLSNSLAMDDAQLMNEIYKNPEIVHKLKDASVFLDKYFQNIQSIQKLAMHNKTFIQK